MSADMQKLERANVSQQADSTNREGEAKNGNEKNQPKITQNHKSMN